MRPVYELEMYWGAIAGGSANYFDFISKTKQEFVSPCGHIILEMCGENNFCLRYLLNKRFLNDEKKP